LIALGARFGIYAQDRVDVLRSVEVAHRDITSRTAQRLARNVACAGTQYSQPLIQELILQESDEALMADRAESSSDHFRTSASLDSIGKEVFNEVFFALPSCTSSSSSFSNCVSTEQQRTALL
jgi:hypothetical protein